MRTQKILCLLGGTDEVKHRHTLRKNRDECCIEGKQEVLPQSYPTVYGEAQVNRDREAGDSQQ